MAETTQTATPAAESAGTANAGLTLDQMNAAIAAALAPVAGTLTNLVTIYLTND